MDMKEGHDYAWNWFVYHAEQRMVAFQIFLIFFGALAVGFAYSLEHHNFYLVRAVALAAAFIAFAFLVLEIRNEQLVNVGRAALLKVEESNEFKDLPSELKLMHVDRTRSKILSHMFWFRAIYFACIFIFGWLSFHPQALHVTDQDKGSASQVAPAPQGTTQLETK